MEMLWGKAAGADRTTFPWFVLGALWSWMPHDEFDFASFP
jgi:hypothetical protein